MKRRKNTQGGQAIVLVTLGLLSMVGMMGLAVDLGWSYFVQKQAQAAADSAALGAVQEAMVRLGGGGGNITTFNCASLFAGTSSTAVDCQPSPVICENVIGSSNLHNGCLYAAQNGFDPSKNPRQTVLMQSSDVLDNNRPPGIKRMSYWARARTIQTIPQLFSFVAGTQGTVAANATAGIVGSIGPGSFYGMNHSGDCQNLANTLNCGLDLVTGNGKGKATCPGGNGSGQVCAPSGIFLASMCPNTTFACSKPYAGDASGNGVMAASLVIMGDPSKAAGTQGGLVNGNWHDASGTALTPVYTLDPATFKDPTSPNPQPPIMANPNNTLKMASCGVKTSLTGTIGPFQYFHYTNSDAAGKPIPDGVMVSTSGTTVFSASGGCPGWNSTTQGLGGVTQAGSSFPTYVFYGGLSAGGTTVTMGAGQYIMAGTTGAAVFREAGGNITGDVNTGTMFVFTDGNYPALVASNQISTVPNGNSALLTPGSAAFLSQGNLDFKNGNVTLNGLANSTSAGSALPAALDGYTGIVWWQDRRNSFVEYNQLPTANCSSTICSKDDGTVVACADCKTPATPGMIQTENHVNNTSPNVLLDPGNVNLALTGVYYQPRGASLTFVKGAGNGSLGGALQVITGSLDEGPGADTVLLQGPTNPLLTYKTALIQ